jgi:hypothetical protein
MFATLKATAFRVDDVCSQAIFGEPDVTTETSPVAHSTDFSRCYREQEKTRIVAAMRAASSLLVVGGAGCGKSALAEFVASGLRADGFTVALAEPSTAKQLMLDIAEQLSVGATTLDGKAQSTGQLQEAITERLQEGGAFLVVDDAHRLQLQVRVWLEHLVKAGQTILLFATHPPARDVFLKLPRIELHDLSNKAIRELMEDSAASYQQKFSRAKLSELQSRVGGNPMLARRVVTEEHLGLDDTAPDHTKWIDGTPLLMAFLLCFALVRVLGRGMHMHDLWMFGMVLSIALGVTRLLMRSLPRQSSKLGA